MIIYSFLVLSVWLYGWAVTGMRLTDLFLNMRACLSAAGTFQSFWIPPNTLSSPPFFPPFSSSTFPVNTLSSPLPPLLARCVQSNIVLLTQAFRKKFVIPDFPTFASHIDELYESAKKLDEGQVRGLWPPTPFTPFPESTQTHYCCWRWPLASYFVFYGFKIWQVLAVDFFFLWDKSVPKSEAVVDLSLSDGCVTGLVIYAGQPLGPFTKIQISLSLVSSFIYCLLLSRSISVIWCITCYSFALVNVRVYDWFPSLYSRELPTTLQAMHRVCRNLSFFPSGCGLHSPARKIQPWPLGCVSVHSGRTEVGGRPCLSLFECCLFFQS